MELLTKIMLNKLKNEKGGGGSDSKMNLFIQNDQPSGYKGIWIKSNNLGISNIAEVADENSLVASSINIVKGNKYETILFDSEVQNGLHYKFNQISFTDSENNGIYEIPTYYGNGQSWIDITPLADTVLQYIQSTGTQYINTGYYPNTNTNAKYKVLVSSFSEYGPHLLSSHNYFFPYFRIKDYALKCTINKTQFGINNYQFATNKEYEFEAIWNDKILIDGVEKLTLDTYTKTETRDDMPLYIGAYMGEGHSDYTLSGKIYYCKIYDGNTLVRDLLPVRRRSDNEICLYDKITKTYFTNAGTGAFVAGPEVQ